MPTPGAGSGPYAGLQGRALPGGRVRLDPHVAWLWADCMTATPSREHGHPTVGFLLAIKGMGITWDELFALVDATAESGVVLGETELEFGRPLRVGEEYEVVGAIEQVVRSAGRRAGTFDRMRVRIALHELGSGDLACAVANTMIFPRGERAA